MLSDSRVLLNPTPVKLPHGKYSYFYKNGEGVVGESASCSQQWCRGPRGKSKKSSPSDLGVKIWAKKKQGCLKWNEASQGTMLGNVGNRDRAY